MIHIYLSLMNRITGKPELSSTKIIGLLPTGFVICGVNSNTVYYLLFYNDGNLNKQETEHSSKPM